jgi:PucR-like helix-turn-helix protein
VPPSRCLVALLPASLGQVSKALPGEIIDVHGEQNGSVYQEVTLGGSDVVQVRPLAERSRRWLECCLDCKHGGHSSHPPPKVYRQGCRAGALVPGLVPGFHVTAGALYCHRNTVRNRLQHLEELTGQSLAEPSGLTLLSVAATGARLLGLWADQSQACRGLNGQDVPDRPRSLLFRTRTATKPYAPVRQQERCPFGQCAIAACPRRAGQAPPDGCPRHR